MENRHLDKSPPKKKGRIMTKTKYFFQPTNNLVNLNAEREKDKDAEPEGEQPEAVNSIAGFSLPKDLLAGEELEANANGTLKEGSAVTPTKFIDYERLIREQQSSDDSFDGIRWGGGSPEKQKMSTGVMVGGTLAASRLHRSSPLKNETSPVNNEVFSVNNNDQVNSVLNKYGTGFDNILSQTPTLQKTYSDILSSESKRKRNKIDFPLDTSPTIMMRSKTLGIDEMKAFNEPKKKSIKPVKAATSESALNSWLTKFEDKPQKKSSQGLQMPIQVEKNLRCH